MTSIVTLRPSPGVDLQRAGRADSGLLSRGAFLAVPDPYGLADYLLTAHHPSALVARLAANEMRQRTGVQPAIVRFAAQVARDHVYLAEQSADAHALEIVDSCDAYRAPALVRELSCLDCGSYTLTGESHDPECTACSNDIAQQAASC